tara:strand:- start:607 stop:849 length:243 start_codon:yes stop_codon:yes gene_type:complete
MAEIKRKQGETFESMLRRFNKTLQRSGKMLQFQKNRFHEESPNKNKMRTDALRRLTVTEKREYLKRIGRLKEEPRKRRRR